jgi:hypothetical protein
MKRNIEALRAERQKNLERRRMKLAFFRSVSVSFCFNLDLRTLSGRMHSNTRSNLIKQEILLQNNWNEPGNVHMNSSLEEKKKSERGQPR